jgi:Leucine-rich repeat (LRR) protein
LEELPEIIEIMENLKVLNLDETSIKELPSSLHHLVGLQKLSLRNCTKLKTIPSFIGNLSELLELDLTGCASLETFPSSLFKLKLTKLDLKGCSMLGTFPEIPNDIGRLSSLTELSLQGSSIVNLPESMANLSSLESLDLTDCKRLECVPNNIGRWSSLTKLSLQGSSIANLPESMAHLSSLKSLNLSACKLLETVLKLPPNLNQVSAFDCPSIKRMVLNSRSKSRNGIFKFHLTNNQELDAASWSNIEEEVCIKITTYWSVFFCFPGGAIPCWFHYCCKGHSVAVGKVSPNLLIGFALCVILGPSEDMSAMRIGNASFMYKFGLKDQVENLVSNMQSNHQGTLRTSN